MGCGASQPAPVAPKPIVGQAAVQKRIEREATVKEVKAVEVTVDADTAKTVQTKVQDALGSLWKASEAKEDPLPERPSTRNCAVTLQLLLSVAEHIPENWPTFLVTKHVVLPITEAHKSRLVDVPGLVPPRCVSTPTYFASHWWSGTFVRLVRTLKDALHNADPSGVFVWLDIFAINQWAPFTEAGLLRDLKGAIQASSGGTMVMLGEDGGALTRVWCLYEFWNTARLKGPESLHMMRPPGMLPAQLTELGLSVQAESAKYTKKDDYDRILADIRADYKGDTQHFNVMLRSILMLDPLDYSADLAGLLTHGGDPKVWDLQPIVKWQSSPEPGHLAVWGPAGTGKSTLSAVMLAAAGLLPPSVSDLVGGSGLAAPEHRLQIHAYHFCKASDTRRLDPLGVVRTLAYHLATHPDLPAFTKHIASLQKDAVASLANKDDALQLLLAQPLALHQAAGGGAVVVLLDALDEADDPRPGVPLPGLRNQMLQLAKQLRKLPGLRVIVTARPEAHLMAPLQLPVLPQAPEPPQAGDKKQGKDTSNKKGQAPSAAPPPRPVTTHQLSTSQLLDRGRVAEGVQQALASAVEGREGGPSAAELAEQLLQAAAAAAQATSDAAAAAAGEAGRPDGGQDPAQPQPQTPAQQANPGSSPGMSMVYVAVVSCLLQRGILAPGSALPATLPDAYATALDHALAALQGDQAAAQGLQRLLAVLLASREPLAPAQLVALGLQEHLARLPLWGVLYFERDMRVQTLHKTLTEWMREVGAARAGAGAAGGSTAGHSLLALSLAPKLREYAQVDPHGPAAKGVMDDYMLRHALVHLIQASRAEAEAGGSGDDAGPATRGLRELLLHLGYWQALFEAGKAADVLGDLQAEGRLAAPAAQGVVREVSVWVRTHLAFLGRRPRALLQFACDAPDDSHLGRAAAALLASGAVARPAGLRIFKELAQAATGGDATAAGGGAVCVAALGVNGSADALAFSPDGSLAVSGGSYKRFALWDVSTGQLLGNGPPCKEDISKVMFSVDGSAVLWKCRGKEAKWSAWHLASGRQLPDDEAASAVETIEGPRLAAGLALFSLADYTGVHVFSEREARNIEYEAGLSWEEQQRMMSVIPDWHKREYFKAKAILAGSLIRMGPSNDVGAIWGENAKGGKEAVAATNGTLYYVIVKGRHSARLGPHESLVESVAFSHDGNYCATGTNDSVIRLWDLRASGRLLGLLVEQRGGVGSLAFSPDSSLLLSGSGGSIRVWDVVQALQRGVAGQVGVGAAQGAAQGATAAAVEAAAQRLQLQMTLRDVLFSPDCKQLMVRWAYHDAVYFARLYDVASQQLVREIMINHMSKYKIGGAGEQWTDEEQKDFREVWKLGDEWKYAQDKKGGSKHPDGYSVMAGVARYLQPNYRIIEVARADAAAAAPAIPEGPAHRDAQKNTTGPTMVPGGRLVYLQPPLSCRSTAVYDGGPGVGKLLLLKELVGADSMSPFAVYKLQL